jgi:stage II sporulation protein D
VSVEGTAPRRLTSAGIALALAVAAACTPGDDGSTRPERTAAATTRAASPSGTAASPAPERDAVRVSAPRRGGSLLLRGTYPQSSSRCAHHEQPTFEARYPGTLFVRRAGDGTLTLTLALPFESYLEGIAEVPPSWPIEALKAQAIAARTYALATTGWDGQEGEELDTAICATSACQVYRGVPVPFDPAVRRWYRAVRQTRGEVIVYDGRPAETVYFSTSNGRTYGNEDVFGSAPLPYLRPVQEHDDGASPVSRWRVTLPFDDLARFLELSGQWPGGRIRSVRLRGDRVIVSGGGTSRRIDDGAFREAVNTWAPCLEPARYPPPSPRGSRLPVTIPSMWASIARVKDGVEIDGRGWGHGVGMVQWGAYGKAGRGQSAEQILSFYYGGFTPQPFPEPGLIHVRVASGLTSLKIRPSGPGARVDGRELAGRGLSIEGGEELTVRAPTAGA